MSAMTEPATNAEPGSPVPTEASARKGYRDLVGIIERAHGTHGGVHMGSPKDGILVGITLDNAAPVYVDLFALKPRILGIMGDAGTGKTFAAHLFALRAKWTWPDRTVDVADGLPAAWPRDLPKRRGVKVVPRAVIATLDGNCQLVSKGFRNADPAYGGEYAFCGVVFRMASPPDHGGFLKPTERAWLPKARLPTEAGYSEGLYTLPYGNVPVAVVASTPEYEFLVHTLPAGGTPKAAASA